MRESNQPTNPKKYKPVAASAQQCNLLREWAAEKCKKQRIEDQNKKKTKRTKRIGAKERPTYHDNNENKKKKKNGGGEGGGASDEKKEGKTNPKRRRKP